MPRPITALACLFWLPSAFLLSNIVRAEQVTEEMARGAAQAFLLKEQISPPQVATKTRGEFVARDQAAGMTLGDIHPITVADGSILAYVQELSPLGFIITSADDAMRPVLGFSFSGNWDVAAERATPLVDLIIADMHCRKRTLNAMSSSERESTIQASKDAWAAELDYAPSTSNARSYSEVRGATVWGPWLQTEWAQTGHWNNKCPYTVKYIPGFRRPTGCVATAMAQIINYWEYPSSVDFSDNAFISIGGTYHTFDDSSDWGFPSLPDLRNGMDSVLYNGNDEEEAFLCFAAGVKLHMNYGVFESGANTYSVRDALNSHFGFGSAIADSDRDGVWLSHRDEIIEDIKNGYPVQIGIHVDGETGGHSVVVDGYREDNEYFWVNMGWGGSSNAWYNIPSISNYDVVHTVVYGIARYQGWNQIGADQRNSYHAIYPAPIQEPVRKWPVNVPSGLPTSYRYGHMIIGTGGRIYASLNPDILGDNYHPYVAIFDKFGTRENLINVPQSNTGIAFLSQNSRGEVFFGSDHGGPSATNSKLFRLNPRTDQITNILTHSSPDTGIFEQPIKVDRDDYLYFVITPRQTENYAKFYAVSRTGAPKWTEKSFPASAEFHRTIPAIDEERDRVYLNYFERTGQFDGRSRLIAFKRSDGSQVFDVILPNIPAHFASAMAGAPSIGENGTVYIGAYTHLYAYSSNGTKLWEKSFDPAYSYRTPAIGSDGALYVNYGKLISGNWRPGFVRALDPSNGNTKWEVALSLGENDHMGEIYAAANGMVIYSYDKDGVYRLGGVKDDGATYGSTWDMQGGGTLAFGPGRTIFSIPPGQEQSIWALSDFGEPGDADGLGMDFADNGQPFSPSAPSPADATDDQPATSVQLSWSCSDPDGHSLKYDVFACALVEDEEAAFVPVASQITETSYALTGLQEGTQYLWTVVATDGQAIVEGPAWSFTTEAPSDQCPDDPNKTQPGICGCGVPDVDTDSDGAPDCIDRCDGFDDNADDDTDGVANGCDNCRNVPNPNQADSDNDGVGDACNPIVDGCAPGTDDDDDSICNDGDNCPNIANVDQSDLDGDGVGDACDECPNDRGKTQTGDCGCGVVDSTPCPSAGFCCVTDGGDVLCYRDETASTCEDLGGVFVSDSDECSFCQMGACCDPMSGICELTTAEECGGEYMGQGSDCAPNPCTPEGACCYPTTGVCVIVSPDECMGDYRGNNTDCSCPCVAPSLDPCASVGAFCPKNDESCGTFLCDGLPCGNLADLLGQTIVVEAVPPDCQRFVAWAGSVSSSQNPISIEITPDLDLHAIFEDLPPTSPGCCDNDSLCGLGCLLLSMVAGVSLLPYKVLRKRRSRRRRKGQSEYQGV